MAEAERQRSREAEKQGKRDAQRHSRTCKIKGTTGDFALQVETRIWALVSLCFPCHVIE
jgi:hypothetical protein